MSQMIKQLRREAEIWDRISSSPEKMDQLDAAAAAKNWTEHAYSTFRITLELSSEWRKHGGVVYDLSHSTAALFVLTSAPPIERLPHRSFLIKVPQEFLPSERPSAGPDTWIFVSQRGYDCCIGYRYSGDSAGSAFTFFSLEKAVDLERKPDRLIACDNRSESRYLHSRILACRIAANLVAYTESTDSIIEKKNQFSKAKQNAADVFSVRLPKDVVVTSEFRSAAAAIVGARSIQSIRRALAHVVRGHWRNQACGEKRSARKRIWIHPHRRGDESLGRVVERIERITGAV